MSFDTCADLALAFHASGLAVAMSSSYLLIVHVMGGIEPVIGFLPDVVSSHVPHEAGTLAVAFFMAELTAPPRYALTIVVAPLIAEKVRGRWLGDVLGLIRREPLLRLAYLPGRGLLSKGV